jgi:hypothetical protein
VTVFTKATTDGFESSCKQRLNTFTGKAHCALLFDASVAVQVTVVVPTGNIDPGGGLHTTEGLGVQLSVAAGVANFAKALTAKGHEACAARRMLGQPFVNAGGFVSTTVTVAWHWVETFWLSVTVSVTGVSPGP